MTLVWRPGYGGAAVSDPDAQAYLQAVEVADNQALEQGVQQAVNQFVIGCKADGIWSAIKASCILAGARTLAGALIPLAGTAPTNNNFVSGDYNRKTGLGDASNTTKYLNSNRAGTADPQDSIHASMYISTLVTDVRLGHNPSGAVPPDSDLLLISNSGFGVQTRCRTTALAVVDAVARSNFIGINRSDPTFYIGRANGSNTPPINQNSVGRSALNTFIFAQSGDNNLPSNFSNSRIAFYSIGESLDLAKLDTRVSALITAIGAAIP